MVFDRGGAYVYIYIYDRSICEMILYIIIELVCYNIKL